MRFKICLFIMLALGLLMQGCGRKGPLTLPQVSSPTTAPAQPPAK